jgi:NAD(P)-dependent dehydrogenase (short-subunit alcohol dehydrogenase family)
MMRLVHACEDFFVAGTRLIGIGGHYGFEPTAYAATAGIGNAALANLIKQYSIALGEKGVTAHLVAPGPADTARLHRVAKARAERVGQSVDTVLAEMRSESSIGEFTDVSAVAWAVMSLLSPHASAMTGSTLFLDAGRRRGI